MSIAASRMLHLSAAARGNHMPLFRDTFLAHPDAAGETYFEHMAFALCFSGRLFRAAFAAALHGVVPAAFETTASTAILSMSDELRARRTTLAAGKVAQGRA